MYRILSAVAAACVLSAAAGCSKRKTAVSAGAGSTKKVYVAHTQTYVPYVFVDEKGKSDGFEVAVWREIGKLYPQYEIQFVPTSDDDLLIGVETGKYNVGIKGAWSTTRRRQKYLFPKNYLGASIIGLTFRKENADRIHDLESFAAFSGRLVPIAPQSAQYAIIMDFNRQHPAAPIHLVPSEVFDIPESYTWVLEKRYDGFFDLQVAYKRNVLAENGAYHQYADKLAYVVYKAIPTWPLFNKNETQLAADYDAAIEKFHSDGTYGRLADTYFGADVSKYVEKDQTSGS
jgi:L-cystine transport system substrate-binding protein